MHVYKCICPYLFFSLSLSLSNLFISFCHNGILAWRANGTWQSKSVYICMWLWLTLSLPLTMSQLRMKRFTYHICRPFGECISMYTLTHVYTVQIECHSKVLNYARTFWMLLLCAVVVGVVTWKSIVLNNVTQFRSFSFAPFFRTACLFSFFDKCCNKKC